MLDWLKNPSVLFTLFLIGLAFVAYAVFPGVASEVDELFSVLSSGDKQKIQNWLREYGNTGPYILLLIFLLQMFLFVLPSVLVMSLCILMYGEVWGSLLCLAGIFLASSVAYVIGRSLSGITIDKLLGKDTRSKMEDFLNRYGFWAIFVFRVSPFLSNDAVSFAGGLTKMGYGRFIMATMLGITPLTLLLAWLGSQTEQYEMILFITGIIGLAGLGLYIYADRKRKANAKK